MKYGLSDFDFELPKELIAHEPARPRDHARLLVYDRAIRSITDDFFYNLGNYLPGDASLVINNSKVEKCRLRFGGVELFVLETHNDKTVSAMVRPGRKFKLGAKVELPKGIIAEVVGIDDDGVRRIVLNKDLNDKVYDPFRLTPLPFYIPQDESLSDEYQTVYARPMGSKAAPTAGLHFTDDLLNLIRIKHDVIEITLHVGLGTFAPVKSEDLTKHKMHEEWFSINQAAAESLNLAKHVTAVGTTSVRTLESADKPFRKQTGDTSIFIVPGYKFVAVDSLITNFHLPKSTLLMLVAAFMGSVDELRDVYRHAIEERYRFYSFGDAMLIL
jgi:S-adenosylmethionine:tRNA ribosyltransferase-isomerase